MAKTWQVVLATIAIFVAGAVAGGATAVGFLRWRGSRVPAGLSGGPASRPNRVEQFGPQLMRNFANQLDLTEEQRMRIMPIVRRTAGQLARERREVQLATALAIERMQDEIADQLTPGQRDKFEELIAKQRARLQELRKSPTPPPDAAQPAPPPPPK
jgi:Spy/CpxP family protein refolding chaperone